MPNRRLSKDELATANSILIETRTKIDLASKGDRELRFALNRKLAKELTYDERSKPAARKKLKAKKRVAQSGTCAVCRNQLPLTPTVLDRFRAADGYTFENTRLICQSCDAQIQIERGYS